MLLSLAALTIATGSAGAATILTGVVPSVDNDPVPAGHGSNEVGTPNVTLDWSTGGDWDQYSNWDGRGDAYQIEASNITPAVIVFTPDANWITVTITSFDLDEYVGGDDTTVNWTISGSSSGTLASGTWDDFNNVNDPFDLGGRSTVTPNVTGADGEALTLSFEQTFGLVTYLAMDNLTFAQAVPEPSSTALLGLGGLVLMLRRKRS
jgi:hypothetical protein